MRCDGLVAATPAGSTGYNLANQGPILAWGVEGYVVSFIAPHTLTARALVVAPDDVLQVGNAAGREPVDVAGRGRRQLGARWSRVACDGGRATSRRQRQRRLAQFGRGDEAFLPAAEWPRYAFPRPPRSSEGSRDAI